MIQLLDLNYYYHKDIRQPEQLLELHSSSISFARYFQHKIKFIKHLNYNGSFCRNNIEYIFFKRKGFFCRIPFKTHRFIKSIKPDIILIEGHVFPIQVIFLRLTVSRKTKLLVQHHGESPFRGIKRLLQVLAGRCIDGFIFTAKENANLWIKANIISIRQPLYEILEGSSNFHKYIDNSDIKKNLGISGDLNFLWVGRLNYNKDPITVLKAFKSLLTFYPTAKLYMIYQDGTLLDEVKSVISEEMELNVSLIGMVRHVELEKWYNATDFYISGSHREGSGYALIEAMSCGSIPVVTNIPSFKKITAEGSIGFLYEPGDSSSLTNIMCKACKADKVQMSEKVIQHFRSHLSFEKIAADIEKICGNFMPQQV